MRSNGCRSRAYRCACVWLCSAYTCCFYYDVGAMHSSSSAVRVHMYKHTHTHKACVCFCDAHALLSITVICGSLFFFLLAVVFRFVWRLRLQTRGVCLAPDNMCWTRMLNYFTAQRRFSHFDFVRQTHIAHIRTRTLRAYDFSFCNSGVMRFLLSVLRIDEN